MTKGSSISIVLDLPAPLAPRSRRRPSANSKICSSYCQTLRIPARERRNLPSGAGPARWGELMSASFVGIGQVEQGTLAGVGALGEQDAWGIPRGSGMDVHEARGAAYQAHAREDGQGVADGSVGVVSLVTPEPFAPLGGDGLRDGVGLRDGQGTPGFDQSLAGSGESRTGARAVRVIAHRGGQLFKDEQRQLAGLVAPWEELVAEFVVRVDGRCPFGPQLEFEAEPIAEPIALAIAVSAPPFDLVVGEIGGGHEG